MFFFYLEKYEVKNWIGKMKIYIFFFHSFFLINIYSVILRALTKFSCFHCVLFQELTFFLLPSKLSPRNFPSSYWVCLFVCFFFFYSIGSLFGLCTFSCNDFMFFFLIIFFWVYCHVSMWLLFIDTRNNRHDTRIFSFFSSYQNSKLSPSIFNSFTTHWLPMVQWKKIFK